MLIGMNGCHAMESIISRQKDHLTKRGAAGSTCGVQRPRRLANHSRVSFEAAKPGVPAVVMQLLVAAGEEAWPL